MIYGYSFESSTMKEVLMPFVLEPEQSVKEIMNIIVLDQQQTMLMSGIVVTLLGFLMTSMELEIHGTQI